MKKIILLILCLLPLAMFAQSAMDYFHTSANYYVNADKKNAKTSVQEGIRKYPDNQKLKTLASKIDQLPDPEDDQSKQNQNQQNQENKQQQQQRKEDAKRQLDALQQNERRTQEKAKEVENRQAKPAKQEKDW